MKLPISILPKKKELPHYYLALLLKDEKISAVIFEEIAGKVHVVGEHDVFLDIGVEDVEIEDLLQALDKAISTAESKVPENQETQKTIFGLKEEWIAETGIKKAYKGKLKKICDELGLSPIGFMVISEAIAHLLQKQEGAPVSGLLVESSVKNITISLFKAGKVLEVRTAPIEGSVVHSVDTLLHHFSSVEVLPSRIILFDSKDADRLSQDFIGHSWSRRLPFLHMPQITVLPKGFDAEAVLFGAATQLGFELSKDESIPRNIDVEEKKEDTKTNEEEEKTPKIEEKEDEKEAVTENPALFGFVKEQDILDLPEGEEKGENAGEEGQEDEKESVEKEPLDEENYIIPKNPAASSVHEKNKNTSRFAKMVGFGSIIKKAVRKVHIGNILAKIPMRRFPFPRGNKFFLVIPLVILILLGGFLFFYLFNLKATVVLSLTPKVIQKTQNMTFVSNAPSDFSNNQISIKTFSLVENGSATGQATGSKEIGDKAKGTVTFYNISSDDATVAAGTVLTSSNNLKFDVDKDVTVPAGSSDPLAPKSGTAQGSVTAEDFGTDYNLPSDTKFSLDGTSSVAAKNDEAFSGGTKKTVTVVSQSDIDKLVSTITDAAATKAKLDSQKQGGSDNVVLPVFLSSDVTQKQTDKKAGDEAKTVTMNATITYTGATYNSSDVANFFMNSYSSTLPSDLTLPSNGVSFQVQNVTKKSDNAIAASVQFNAKLLPKTDPLSIAKSIAGKPETDAKETLIHLPQVSDATITFHPTILGLLKRMPQKSDNITVTIENNE